MSGFNTMMVQHWRTVGLRFLPFADASTRELPLSRLIRLSLFQATVGMAAVLLTGTLNRVMIVELGLPASIVAVMVALPLLFAPFRALIGHQSDNYRSLLGWRRVPYIWYGTLLQFGGLAIMPFALLLMQSQTTGPEWAGPAGAALAFLLVGAGMHTTQTAGLALATDLAPVDKRPRVVALMYVMVLLGMVVSSGLFALLLRDFSPTRLIQVIQGAAVVTLVLNVVALWKQEARNPAMTAFDRPRQSFSNAWANLRSDRRSGRLLLAVGLGSAGFSMQDVLLEPYGGEILGLAVSQTTLLTALLAGGTLMGFALAARQLTRGSEPHRLAAFGALIGIFAFSAVVFASPLASALLFRIGTVMIGFGGGLFAVGTMTAAMDLADRSETGIAIGAWGAVQATAAGLGLALGGAIRDIVGSLAISGRLGEAMADPATGYSVVYHIEIALLFMAIAIIGPLARRSRAGSTGPSQPPHYQSRSRREFGLADLPG